MRDQIQVKQIYYIAGLIEGEGCFGFYGTPTIQLYMSDYEPVRKLRNLMVPNCAIRSRKQISNLFIGRKIQYILRFSGIPAIGWMMTLYPLMSPRRQKKIREVIDNWKVMLGRKKEVA